MGLAGWFESSRQKDPSPDLRIPHTEVYGLFRSNLPEATLSEPRESHTRKCVDGSDPAYMRAHTELLNPTHGSSWMVQSPPHASTRRVLEFHPRRVCLGSFEAENLDNSS